VVEQQTYVDHAGEWYAGCASVSECRLNAHRSR
jgi:hypothetical protein